MLSSEDVLFHIALMVLSTAEDILFYTALAMVLAQLKISYFILPYSNGAISRCYVLY